MAVRVKCNQSGLFGTLVGPMVPPIESDIKPGKILDVAWLDYPEDVDEIEGGKLTIVSETLFHLEIIERGIDKE